jgi:UDP-glucose 4-epimerase
MAVNIGGSLNLLEAARKFGVPRVIYGSSISVYGSQDGRDGVAETDPAAPEDVYGASKRYVEIVGETFRRRFGIEFVALRIASVVGPGAVNTSSPWRSEIFERLGRAPGGEVSIPYRDTERLPLVHVDEVAGMVRRLVEAERVSACVYNTPAESWVLADLARLVESLDGDVRIRFGEAEVRGIPRAVDGHRFEVEFGYTPLSLRERFQRAADSGDSAGDGRVKKIQESD